MNQPLSESYTARPATQDDAALVCELWNARSSWAQNTNPHSGISVLKRWDDPRFNLEADSLLVFGASLQLVGYAHIRDVANPPVDVFCSYSVHPEYDEQDALWQMLFEWIESEARRVIAKAPVDARIALVAGARDEDPTEHQRLEALGFEYSRTFHRMAIEFEKPMAPSSMPVGTEICTFVPGVDDEALVHACRDAFRDHYGRLEQPFEADLAKWRRWMEEDDFDTDLWFLAIHEGEVCGYCCCYPSDTREEGVGLIDELGVCPDWRRRGIGRGLLMHSLQALQKRGLKGAHLRVDSGNKNQALTLYESVGMHVVSSSHTYVRELRPGVNLVAQ